ncbi:hypothetical protein [Aestuariibacter sp. A3R04]|uniref:hypothetical protein n=1 Tax=Aestuariibacter sp. A3R04 TaxID=2841571 RepID=UPI001C087E18|nr:hypothetical protein [Aestuariibacter sp. A3R04]MBU3022170.1 hypothetical protein [Aestuariibacter sp. A3R04]
MNKELNHSLTPPALADINAKILQCLAGEDEETRYQSLLKLIQARDDIIQSHLLTLDKNSARSFAEQEVSVNNKLSEVAQTLLKSAKDDVSHFLRSQKAAKKYR